MAGRPLIPDNFTAAQVVQLLRLEPLDQEGGYFRRTAESGTILPDGRRAHSVIYSLFTPEAFSAMHRLKSDEIWCFHAGDPLESLRLGANGSGAWVKLGLNLAVGEKPQDVISAGIWQGTRIAAGGRWALLSCVVAPEFVWTDFELGERVALCAAYPEFVEGIGALTRGQAIKGAR